MSKALMNLQDNFLNQCRKDNIPVTIYLVSGVQLKGIIRGFDSFTVVLESPGKPAQLVYKHALASVVPAKPVNNVIVKEESVATPTHTVPKQSTAEEKEELAAEE